MNVSFNTSGKLFLILMACCNHDSLATEELRHLDAINAFKTIVIEGADIPKVLNQPLDTFSLAAVIDDEMEPIPFQIDEYNIGGAVYFEDWDVPISGEIDIFDPNDKLLFIYKDAGTRRKPNHQYDGEIIHEIELTNKLNDVRYAYIIKNSRLRSDEQYVRYSADEALVETDFYSITYNKDNHVIWDDFSIENYDGEENPLDALKIRLDTGVIIDLAKIELNNGDLIATPKSERIGPIRTTTQMELVFWFLNLPYVTVSLQLHHAPNSLVYDIRAILPALRRKMLANPQIRLSLEGNNLFGAEIRTALGPTTPAYTDGKMDDIELKYLSDGISIKNNWIWWNTKRNLDFLAFFNFNSELTEPISFFYNDDDQVIDQPERFPGQLPNVGYKIHSLPKDGYFGFTVNIHLSNGYRGNPALFSKDIRQLPDISIFTPQKTFL